MLARSSSGTGSTKDCYEASSERAQAGAAGLSVEILPKRHQPPPLAHRRVNMTASQLAHGLSLISLNARSLATFPLTKTQPHTKRLRGQCLPSKWFIPNLRPPYSVSVFASQRPIDCPGLLLQSNTSWMEGRLFEIRYQHTKPRCNLTDSMRGGSEMGIILRSGTLECRRHEETTAKVQPGAEGGSACGRVPLCAGALPFHSWRACPGSEHWKWHT